MRHPFHGSRASLVACNHIYLATSRCGVKARDARHRPGGSSRNEAVAANGDRRRGLCTFCGMPACGSSRPVGVQPEASRGRLHAEPESASRSCFQRDRDRIIHSAAFRRLEYKTQVFVNHEGDFFRTRLTHSLEVSQIARSICRALRLNEDLAEALALAHDLGHPPFGHAGEDALKEMMEPCGGFDHNAQSLRVVTTPGAALCRVRRPQPDLGDAGGRGQAQRPADRAMARPGRCRRPSPSTSSRHDLELAPTPAPRRRSLARRRHRLQQPRHRRRPARRPVRHRRPRRRAAGRPGCSRASAPAIPASRRPG